MLRGEKSTPDFDSDWQEAKEDVLDPQSYPKSFNPTESLPGPDIGAGVDDEEEPEAEAQEMEEVRDLFTSFPIFLCPFHQFLI